MTKRIFTEEMYAEHQARVLVSKEAWDGLKKNIKASIALDEKYPQLSNTLAANLKRIDSASAPLKVRNKYGNTRTEVEGVSFDSKREAKRWKELRLLLRTGMLKWLGRQVEFILPGGIIYKADFVYIQAHTDDLHIEDSKGVRTPEYKLKAKLMKERGYTIVEV